MMYHDDEPPSSLMVKRTEIEAVRPNLKANWRQLDRAFSIRVTRSFWSRMNLEDPNDPLARQVIADKRELLAGDFDEPDPVGDAICSITPWLIRKYDSRMLLMMTKRCHLYCRYCFRREHEPDGLDPTQSQLDEAIELILKAKPEEVILSGGDPLIVKKTRLFATLQRLMPLGVRRIHTRAPITFPQMITEQFCKELARFSPLWVVVHCNHPNELSEEVDVALANLVNSGIPVLNQSVLLRGVNDDAEVLADLCRQLVRRRISPYYLHITDKVRGNAHLRVDREEAVTLWEELRALVSGVALPSLIEDPPDGSGKMLVR